MQQVTLHVVFHPGSTEVHDAVAYDGQQRVVGHGLRAPQPAEREVEQHAEAPTL